LTRRRLLTVAIALVVLGGFAARVWSPDPDPSPAPAPHGEAPPDGAPPLPGDAKQAAEAPAEEGAPARPRERIHGRVLTATGEPVLAGVKVHGAYDRSSRVAALTDGHGEFELPPIPVGEIALFVHGGGWVSPGLSDFHWGRSNPFVVTLEPGPQAAVDLVAEPAGGVALRVLLPDGSPAAEVMGHLEHSTHLAQLLGIRHPVTRGPEAGVLRFADLLPRLPYGIGAEVPGHAPGTVEVVPVSGRVDELTLTLPSRREIVIRVLDADTGRPIAGAGVEWSEGEGEAGGGGETGGDGSVRFSELPPGEIWFGVNHPEYYRLEDELFVPAGVDGSLTIRMAPGLRISGRAVLPDGRPARGARIRFRPGDGQEHRHAKAAGDGAFEVGGLPPGKCRVSAYADGENDAWFEVGTEVEAGRTGVVLRLERAGEEDDLRRLRVDVLDAGGNPVPYAGIRMEAGDTVYWAAYGVRDGVYERSVRDAPVDAIEVFNARDADYRPLPLGAVREGPFPADRSEVTIRMPEETAIAGVVRGADGRGIPGIVLAALPIDPGTREPRRVAHSWARSGEAGRFRIGGLWKGDYALKVDVPGGWLGPAAPPVFSAGATGCVILLVEGGTLALTVLDPRGEPVPGVRVEIGREERFGPGPYDWTVKGREDTSFTSTEGRVLLRGLDPVSRHVVILDPPEGRTDLAYQVEPGFESGEATVRMLPAARVTVRLAAGEPREYRVWGWVRGRWHEATHERADVFVVGPFPRAPVRLVALPKDREPWDFRGETVDAKPGETLTLRPAEPR